MNLYFTVSLNMSHLRLNFYFFKISKCYFQAENASIMYKYQVTACSCQGYSRKLKLKP